jgi:hypothetical protein
MIFNLICIMELFFQLQILAYNASKIYHKGYQIISIFSEEQPLAIKISEK